MLRNRVFIVLLVFLILIIGLSHADTIDIPPFNCQPLLRDEKYIPITLRFPKLYENQLDNTQLSTPLITSVIFSNIWSLTTLLQERVNTTIRFAIGKPLQRLSPSIQGPDGSSTFDLTRSIIADEPIQYRNSFEFRFCWGWGGNNCLQEVEDNDLIPPSWTNSLPGICLNSFNTGTTMAVINDIDMSTWFNSQASASQLNIVAGRIITQLNRFFNSCTTIDEPQVNWCLPSLYNSTRDLPDVAPPVCGDGFVSRGKECDLSQFFSTTDPYINMSVVPTRQISRCTSECKFSTTIPPLPGVSITSSLGTDFGWYHIDYAVDACRLQTRCGNNTVTITAHRSYDLNDTQFPFPVTDSCPVGKLCDAQSSLMIGYEAGFGHVGLPPPARFPRFYSNKTRCTVTRNEACNAVKWLCRPIGSTAQNDWVTCSESVGKLYVPQDPNNPNANNISTTINTYQNELAPYNPDNYICGPIYRGRQVRCGHPSYPYQVISDSQCATYHLTTKPSEFVLATSNERKSCLAMAYVDIWSQYTVLPIPIPKWKIVSDVQTYTLGPTLGFNTWPPLCNVNDGLIDTISLCFGGCDAIYARHFQCIQFIPNKYDVNGNIIEQSPAQNSTLCENPIRESKYSYERESGRCTYKTMCQITNTETSVVTPVDCTTLSCRCSKRQLTSNKFCYGSPGTLTSPAPSNYPTQLQLMSETPCSELPDVVSNGFTYNRDCADTNKANQCYTTRLSFSGDGTLTARTELPDFYKVKAYNQYCKNLSWSDTVFTPTCTAKNDTDTTGTTFIIVDQDNTDGKLCTTEEVQVVKFCQPIGTQWRCRTTPSLLPTSKLNITNFTPYGYVQATTLTGAQCAPGYSPSVPQFCGYLNWSVQTAECWVEVATDVWEKYEDVSCSGSKPSGIITANVKYQLGCQLRCFDAALPAPTTTIPTTLSSYRLLGRCDGSNMLQWSNIKCGYTASNADECSTTKQKVFAQCQLARCNTMSCTTTTFITVDDQTLCSNPENISTDITIGKTQDCFKFSLSKSLTLPIAPHEYAALATFTANSPSCQFRPVCSYNYNPTTTPLTQNINTQVAIKANVWSTMACSTSFDCSQHGVCGIVERSTRCALYNNNALIAIPTEQPPPTPGPFIIQSNSIQSNIDSSNLNDGYTTYYNQTAYIFRSPFETVQYYDEFSTNTTNNNLQQHYNANLKFLQSLPQHIQNDPTINFIQNEDNTIFTPQSTSSYSDEVSYALDTLFQRFGQTEGCGLVVSQRQCSNYAPTNCYKTECYMPKQFITDPANSFNIPYIPQDGDYSEEACDWNGINDHCALNMDNDENECGQKSIQLYYRCIDRTTNLPVDPSLCTIYGATDVINQENLFALTIRDCMAYRGCEFRANTCYWMNNNEDLYQMMPDTTPSASLCRNIDELGDGVCDLGDFCGHASSASQCRVVDTNNNDEVYQVIEKYCPILFPNDYKNYTHDDNIIHCYNYNRCSSWACSDNDHFSPLLTNDEINTTIRTSSLFDLNRFFSLEHGRIHNSFCRNQLISSSVSQSTCGLKQIKRRVGCLIMLTPPYVTNIEYKWDPDATVCGAIASTTRHNIPPQSITLYSFNGCQNTLVCSTANTMLSPSICNFLLCPMVPSLTPGNFVYNPQMLCVAHNGTLVSESACGINVLKNDPNGRLTSVASTCPLITDFCQNNLQVPLGFGITSNITNAQGKFDPKLNEENAATREATTQTILQYRHFIDSSCSTPVTLSSVSLLQGTATVNVNTTVIAGNSISLTYLYTYYPSTTFIVSVYLVPVVTQQAQFQLPYLITTLPPTTSLRYNVMIPTWVPAGTYILVVFADNVTFDWVSNVYITVINSSTDGNMLQQSTTNINNELSFTPSQYIQSTPSITTTQSISTLQTQYPLIKATKDQSQCNGILCFNGDCIQENDTYTCKCHNGYTGPYCAQTVQCQNAAINCNPYRGIKGPSITNTAFDPSETDPDCNTCHCLGDFWSNSGCEQCSLQCGRGQPDEQCQTCTCPIGYRGQQCECYTKQLSLYYRLPPPFIQTMFARTENQFLPISRYEQAQLFTWKQSIISDLAADLQMPMDSFTVDKFGSTTTKFVVVVNYTLCASYPTTLATPPITPPSTWIDWSTLVNNEQALNLKTKFDQFQATFNSLGQHINRTAPFVGHIDQGGDYDFYTPSFSYPILLRRFQALTSASTMASINSNSNEIDVQQQQLHQQQLHDELVQELANEGIYINPHLPQFRTINNLLSYYNTEFDTLQMDTRYVDLYQYRQAHLATSIVSDSSGGFFGLGDLFDAAACPPNDNACLGQTATLTPTVPVQKQRSKGSFNKNYIALIVLLIFFALVIGGIILLCYSFQRQIWCFTDFNNKREEKRKQDREKQRQQRRGGGALGMNNNTTTNLTATTPTQRGNTLNNTGKSNQTLRDSHTNSADGAKSTGSSNPLSIPEGDESTSGGYTGHHAVSPTRGRSNTNLTNNTTSFGSSGLPTPKRVNVDGLPHGWYMVIDNGVEIYVNEITMKSQRHKPTAEDLEVAEDEGEVYSPYD